MRIPATVKARAAVITIVGLGAVVLIAVGVGALASLLVPGQGVFTVALPVTCVVAVLGGLSAEPIVRRLTGTRESRAIEESPGRPGGDRAVGPGD